MKIDERSFMEERADDGKDRMNDVANHLQNQFGKIDEVDEDKHQENDHNQGGSSSNNQRNLVPPNQNDDLNFVSMQNKNRNNNFEKKDSLMDGMGMEEVDPKPVISENTERVIYF